MNGLGGASGVADLFYVRLHLLYHRSGVDSQSYERVDVDARGRFVIEKLFTGDYELMIGPMSVEFRPIFCAQGMVEIVTDTKPSIIHEIILRLLSINFGFHHRQVAGRHGN
jgi:hypothetical protein